MSLNFEVQWIHGARDCRHSSDPLLQTHRAEEMTFIMRQSKCSSFEAPFLYLLIGTNRSLLIDTGAPMSGGILPIRATVDAILAEQVAPDRRHHLIVGHSHAHSDHAAWDRQFTSRPDTTIVGLQRSQIQARFGIAQWPDSSGTLDLGGRVITVLPIPGHEDHHIAVHDSKTGLILTGDTLYPGLLVVNDWPAYRASARRLAAFARNHHVTCVLGAHIEMQQSPGELFPLGTTFQPDEHVLQLFPEDLFVWAAACERLGDHASGRHAFASFVIDIR